MEHSTSPEPDAGTVIDALVQATNEHDLDALVACFADDYVNETPAHPRRGFRGSAQVRRNWTQIFGSVPDLRAEVPRRSVHSGRVWTEWETHGTRTDGAAFAMRGVVIFEVREGRITAARFYLEPVEETSGDVDESVARLTTAAGGEAAGGGS